MATLDQLRVVAEGAQRRVSTTTEEVEGLCHVGEGPFAIGIWTGKILYIYRIPIKITS